MLLLALMIVPILVINYAFAGDFIGGKHAYGPAFYSDSIFLISIGIGVAAGLITGCIGAGGGFIITPALMAAGVKGILAVGTDMFHIFAKAIMVAAPETALRGACESADPAASARAAGLDDRDGARLAELARALETGLGAPVRFEWLQWPDGGFRVLRCGPAPAPDDGDEAVGKPAGAGSFMKGSPVHTRLCELLALLSTDTLPAPEDPDFRSVNCKTVRDVARIVHQRAVDAMRRLIYGTLILGC